MIDISKTLFIVDGQTEICSIRGKFQKEFNITPEFRKADCNGKLVSVSGYCQKTLPILLFAVGSRFEYVMLVIDLEQRKESPDNFSKLIKSELEKRLSDSLGCKKTLPFKLMSCCPNRMFENWIVADIEGIKQRKALIDSEAKQEQFDGKSGSSVLKKNFIGKYKKTFHAEILFKSINIQRARSNSPSFDTFCMHLQI